MERKWRQRLQTTPSRDLAARGEKGSGARGVAVKQRFSGRETREGRAGGKAEGPVSIQAALGGKAEGLMTIRAAFAPWHAWSTSCRAGDKVLTKPPKKRS